MKTSFYLTVLTGLFLTLEAFSVELRILDKKIQVDGKEATVLSLAQPDGTLGLEIENGKPFDVLLKNTMQVPTSIHWHGLILPNDQDGVAFVTQFPLYPTQSYTYRFPLVQTGTFWMHSHFGLQEQDLLSAPLIIYGPDDKKIADQEVIVFLADFSFTKPSAIYEHLKSPEKMKKGMAMMNMGQDLIDVDYDAFLTNYQTLETPQIVAVETGKKVRLRIINGASASNFFIFLGDIEGQAIAIDGNRIHPLKGKKFELAVAQRIDILVTIPEQGGVFPILAQGEGTNRQTGLILATSGKEIPVLSSKAKSTIGALTNKQEANFHPLSPLSSRPVDKQVTVELGGDMAKYVWTLNGQVWPESTPIVVEKGQRVEMVFKNLTSMSHPMHLHGHVFQVTAMDGKKIDGPMRDTVLVLPKSSLTIQFDADNPGVWPLHCHILYHAEAGMFTVVRYQDYIQPLTPIAKESNDQSL